MVIALMVLMIIALLGAAALSRSQSSLHAVQLNVDRATASSGAERGLAEAVSRLEHGESPPFASVKLDLQDGVYWYEVTKLNSTAVEIYAVAEVNGAIRAIEATVNGTNNRGYTIFATERIVSDDNKGAITGRVGTNGEFRVFGRAPGDEQEIFSPKGECLNCPNLIRSVGPMAVPEPEFPTGPNQACASIQQFHTAIDGENGIPYVCEGKGFVIFAGPIEIKNPPLVIYIDSPRQIYFYGSVLNQGGSASDVQIYVKSEPKDPAEMYLFSADLTSTIYAPGRDLQPVDTNITGSIVMKNLQINDGWLFSAKPDKATTIQSPTGWRVTSWEEVPVR